MDFELNPEQQQLADAVRRWADKDYGFEVRKAIIGSAEGVSAQAWQALAELGVLALPVPSDYDGFDGTAIDQMVVMQALGRALVVEPVLSTAMATHCLTLLAATWSRWADRVGVKMKAMGPVIETEGSHQVVAMDFTQSLH